MASKRVMMKDWVGTWLEKQPEDDVVAHDEPPLLSRRKLKSSCSRDLSPFSLARKQYQGIPPHNIEYQECKGKEKSSEDRRLLEDEDDVVDDIAFAQSGSRHDNIVSGTVDRRSESGNVIRLLYCPSNDSLGSPDMMGASHGELMSSGAKQKKKSRAKEQLKEGEEPGQHGFRPQGSTMAHTHEASQAEPMKLGLVHNRNLSMGAKSTEKVMAKQGYAGTPPQAEGKRGRSASFGFFAFKNLVLG